MNWRAGFDIPLFLNAVAAIFPMTANRHYVCGAGTALYLATAGLCWARGGTSFGFRSQE